MLVLNEELRKVIVVGIGYPTDDFDRLAALRAPDLLPTEPEGGGGDGAGFLGFIQQELIPYIDANYLTLASNRTLAGHSYGGLFTLYALFRATDTFQRYIVMSPALWYGDLLAFEYEEAYAAEHDDLPVELFLSVGELEESIGNLRMVTNLADFNQVLVDRNYPGLEMEMVILEQVDHASSFPGAISRGLLAVFH